MKSLRLKIVDLRVVHMHHIDDLWHVSYTWMHDHNAERVFIGSLLLPNGLIEKTKMQVGDEYTVVWQKTKSLYHDKIVKRVNRPARPPGAD